MPPYRGGALDFLHAALVAVRELLHAADLWRGGACGGEVRWTFCMPHLLLCGNLLAYVAQVLAYVAQVLAYVARV